MSSAPSNVIAFPSRREPEAWAESRQAVADERRRIARELHDVVSYGFATVTVNAAAALQALPGRPQEATESLEAIKEASNEALGELRSILGVLHSDGGDDVAPPGLGRVDTLVANATAAGVPTHLSFVGRPHPLPADVDSAAYRIVQESLTNVLRHACGASAIVRIGYRREQLTLEIVNDGEVSAPSGRGSGRGIPGMRERAEAVGGELEAAPERHGFRVTARLPVVCRQ